MIGVDGGSTDPGPYYLGSGKCVNSRMAMKRDLAPDAARRAVAQRIPLIIGSCGGAGGEPHLQTRRRHRARDRARGGPSLQAGGHPCRAGQADRSSGVLQAGRACGRCAMSPDIDEADDRPREPHRRHDGRRSRFMRALDDGAQVVLGGRSVDPAPWAALRDRAPACRRRRRGTPARCSNAARRRRPEGPRLPARQRAAGRRRAEPMNPIRRCTPFSVANHSLHENASPCFHVEPGGILDTSDCTFEAVSDRAVRVSRHALGASSPTRSSSKARSSPAIARSRSAARATRC